MPEIPTQATRNGYPPRKGRIVRELSYRVEEFLGEMPRATALDDEVVYVIQALDGGPVKIGHSTLKGVAKRVTQLQIGNPQQLVIRGLFSGGMWLEQALHEYFHDSRLKGEWFSLSTDLLALCPEIEAPPDLPKTQRVSFGYARGRS